VTPHLALAISIAAEIAATLSLKAADGLTKVGPTSIVVLGYGLALWLMSTAIGQLPIGFVYALWSSIGMVGAAIGGIVLYRESFNATMLLGIAVIAVGITILAVGQGHAE